MERVVGRIPVLECLRAKRRAAQRLHILRQAKGLEPVLAAAEGISVEECSKQDLNRLSGGVVHQGVVLEAAPLPIPRLEDWLANGLPQNALVVVLDQVEDPHNFGAIVRSAAACGARAVFFGKDRAAPISPASLKSAAGAMEHIDLLRASNLVRGLDVLRNAGCWAAALDAAAPQDLWEADLTGPTALVIGSEGKGLRRLVRQHCDLALRIPLVGAISSLNASVSAGIALAECLRQRRRAATSP